MVWFDADDGGVAASSSSRDEYEYDDDEVHQTDDYRAIEGLASHQDIGELVWMDADDSGDIDDDDSTGDELHMHRMAVSSNSWHTMTGSSGSLLVETLRKDGRMVRSDVTATAAAPSSANSNITADPSSAGVPTGDMAMNGKKSPRRRRSGFSSVPEENTERMTSAVTQM